MSHSAEDVIARFLENIEPLEDGSGCLIWRGNCNGKGYGNFKVGGRNLMAHRASYLIFNGDISGGHWVRHTCNNGDNGCVNPAHLISGTPGQNRQDTLRAGNASSQKLTVDNVKTIRQQLAAGKPCHTIADEFGVLVSTIRQIKAGRSWGWLGE